MFTFDDFVRDASEGLVIRCLQTEERDSIYHLHHYTRIRLYALLTSDSRPDSHYCFAEYKYDSPELVDSWPRDRGTLFCSIPSVYYKNIELVAIWKDDIEKSWFDINPMWISDGAARGNHERFPNAELSLCGHAMMQHFARLEMLLQEKAKASKSHKDELLIVLSRLQAFMEEQNNQWEELHLSL